PGEPDAATYPGGGSAWWTWTAPASGTVLLTGQGYNSAMRVFIGSNLLSLEPVAVGPSTSFVDSFQTSFAAESGKTYQLAAERVVSDGLGSLTFTLMLEARQFSGIKRLDTGELRLQFEATPGPDWVLEASSDLSHWSAIDTNESPSGLFEFID